MSRIDEMMKDLERENKRSRVRFWIVIAIVLVGLGTAWKLGYVERAIAVIKEQVAQVREKVAAQQVADKRAGADAEDTEATHADSLHKAACSDSGLTEGDNKVADVNVPVTLVSPPKDADPELLKKWNPLPKDLFDHLFVPQGAQQPEERPLQLNVVYDISRSHWREGEGTKGLLMNNDLFSEKVNVDISFNHAYLGLSARALENSNVLILPIHGSVAYAKDEQKLIDGYLRRGGTVVVFFHDSLRNPYLNLQHTLLRTYYDAVAVDSYRQDRGVPIFVDKHLRQVEIEIHEKDETSLMRILPQSDWKPLIVDSKDSSLAYAAFRNVGRGHIIFMNWWVVAGKFNQQIWARFWASVARYGLQVDSTKPFEEISVTEGTVRRTKPENCNIPITQLPAMPQARIN